MNGGLKIDDKFCTTLSFYRSTRISQTCSKGNVIWLVRGVFGSQVTIPHIQYPTKTGSTLRMYQLDKSYIKPIWSYLSPPLTAIPDAKGHFQSPEYDGHQKNNPTLFHRQSHFHRQSISKWPISSVIQIPLCKFDVILINMRLV